MTKNASPVGILVHQVKVRSPLQLVRVIGADGSLRNPQDAFRFTPFASSWSIFPFGTDLSMIGRNSLYGKIGASAATMVAQIRERISVDDGLGCELPILLVHKTCLERRLKFSVENLQITCGENARS